MRMPIRNAAANGNRFETAAECRTESGNIAEVAPAYYTDPVVIHNPEVHQCIHTRYHIIVISRPQFPIVGFQELVAVTGTASVIGFQHNNTPFDKLFNRVFLIRSSRKKSGTRPIPDRRGRPPQWNSRAVEILQRLMRLASMKAIDFQYAVQDVGNIIRFRADARRVADFAAIRRETGVAARKTTRCLAVVGGKSSRFEIWQNPERATVK